MVPRAERPYVPEAFFEKLCREAIWQSKLGNFVFQEQDHPAHEVGRRVVNALTRAGPVRRFLPRFGVCSRLIGFFRRRRPEVVREDEHGGRPRSGTPARSQLRQ
jgi:hypothetical protein